MADKWEAIRKDLDIYPIEGVSGKAEENGTTKVEIWGSGREISIRGLAETIKGKLGYEGELHFNTEKPDGTMRKLTNVDLLHSLGFQYKIDLDQGC